MQSTEVIAVAASGPNIVAIQDETQQQPGYAAESDPDDNRYYSHVRISKIVATVNSRPEHTYDFPDGTHISESQSHFTTLVSNAEVWKLFLEIPYVFDPAFQDALPILYPKPQGGRSTFKPYPHRG